MSDMFIIGICDDEDKYIEILGDICKNYCLDIQSEYEIHHFKSGEEVLEYCDNANSKRLDILFLDIEMNGINGIDLKGKLLKEFLIWKIVFVSSHHESVFEAFSQKTIGFLKKPVDEEKLKKYLLEIIKGKEENKVYSFVGAGGKEMIVALDDILCFKGEGSYTRIMYNTVDGVRKELICKRLGEIEKKFKYENFIRAHKSYIVNIAAIVSVDTQVHLVSGISVSIGRAYKNNVYRRYLEYGKQVVTSKPFM